MSHETAEEFCERLDQEYALGVTGLFALVATVCSIGTVWAVGTGGADGWSIFIPVASFGLFTYLTWSTPRTYAAWKVAVATAGLSAVCTVVTIGLAITQMV